MTRSYAFSRKDSNHDELSDAYRELGCSVVDLSSVGSGVPDAVIGAAGITDFAEFKTKDGRLEPAQNTFMQTWRGSIVWVIRDRADVLFHVQSMRKRACGRK